MKELNDHLQSVLDSHNVRHLDLQKFIDKKNQVKDALANYFSSEKASDPIDSGSYAKKTAINTKFDIDCCIPFKKKISEYEKGFESLKDMYNSVFTYLKEVYADSDPDLSKDDVRKQKVSIGLNFTIEGVVYELDVVPGRERPNNGSYGEENTDLTLYINPAQRTQNEIEQNKTSIKTNIKTHVNLLGGEDKKHERKIVKLLKIWKTEYRIKHGGKLIKSFVMEVYTREAFENCEETPEGLWNKLKMVMEHIVEKIENSKLLDPANSNNVISDSMSDTARTQTKRAMRHTISQIDGDSEKVSEHFPINEDYKNLKKDRSSSSMLSTNKFG